jgi:formyltetrahydrofolate deformylase
MQDTPIPENGSSQVLLVECADRPGLVHAITGVLFRGDCNIVSNDEFVDRETSRFFMRTEFTGNADADALVAELRSLLPPGAVARTARAGEHRIAILVSREHHCVAELLIRGAYGELGGSIAAVFSNHETLAPLADRFQVPFHCVPHHGLDRAAHDRAVLEALSAYAPDFIVLAKYMRILGEEFVERYRGRIINIHHSFLPAFVGANPYRQAFERGVKMIGATAHFVSEVLDDGPIIAQTTVPVDHSRGPAEMAMAGHDVEKIVLAKALKLVLEDRVFLNGRRTLVFD